MQSSPLKSSEFPAVNWCKLTFIYIGQNLKNLHLIMKMRGRVSTGGRLHTLVHRSHLHLSLHASKHPQTSASEERLYTNTSIYTTWNTERWNRQLGKIVNLCCLQLSLQPPAVVRISPVTKSTKAQPFNGTGFSPTCAICLSSFDRGISSK